MPFRHFARCLAALALAGCSPRADAPPPAREHPAPAAPTPAASAEGEGRWAVTAAGVGPVRAGMTVAQASAALGAEIQPVHDISDACGFADVPGGPADLSLMVVGDTVVRVDVRGPAVATAAGARIGDSAARIRQLYGARVRALPHKYTDGQYLVVVEPADTLARLVFETDEAGTVTTYRAGRFPEVEWVEGCA